MWWGSFAAVEIGQICLRSALRSSPCRKPASLQKRPPDAFADAQSSPFQHNQHEIHPVESISCGGARLRRWKSGRSACAPRCAARPAANPLRCKNVHRTLLLTLSRAPFNITNRKSTQSGGFPVGRAGGARTHTILLSADFLTTLCCHSRNSVVVRTMS